MAQFDASIISGSRLSVSFAKVIICPTVRRIKLSKLAAAWLVCIEINKSTS